MRLLLTMATTYYRSGPGRCGYYLLWPLLTIGAGLVDAADEDERADESDGAEHNEGCVGGHEHVAEEEGGLVRGRGRGRGRGRARGRARLRCVYTWWPA